MKNDAQSHRWYLINSEGSNICGYAKVQARHLSPKTAAEGSKLKKIVDGKG